MLDVRLETLYNGYFQYVVMWNMPTGLSGCCNSPSTYSSNLTDVPARGVSTTWKWCTCPSHFC